MTFTFDLCQTGHLGPNDALLHPESSNGWKTEGSLWDRNVKHITELGKKNTGGKHVYNVFEVLLLVPSGGDLALCVVCLFSKAVELVLLLSFCLKLMFVSRASHGRPFVKKRNVEDPDVKVTSSSGWNLCNSSGGQGLGVCVSACVCVSPG